MFEKKVYVWATMYANSCTINKIETNEFKIITKETHK